MTDVVPAWPATDLALPDRTLAVRHVPATALGARPALLLHGLGGSSLNWTDLVVRLRDRLECWVPDLNGFGGSPPPRDGDYTPAGHARGMARLVEHLGLGPVHLFGNSLGGAVAVELAARRPDLVASLTLVSPALPQRRPSRDTVHLPVIAVPGLGERLVARYLTADAGARTRATLAVCCADPRRVPALRVAEAEAEVRARDGLPYLTDAVLASLRGLLATFLDTGPDRPWRLARRVRCPVLLVYGRADRLVDSRAAYRATRYFRDAHVVVLADSGHVAQLEHPDLVAEAWRTYLGRSDHPTGARATTGPSV